VVIHSSFSLIEIFWLTFKLLYYCRGRIFLALDVGGLSLGPFSYFWPTSFLLYYLLMRTVSLNPSQSVRYFFLLCGENIRYFFFEILSNSRVAVHGFQHLHSLISNHRSLHSIRFTLLIKFPCEFEELNKLYKSRN